MRLTVLGSSGTYPSRGRACAGYLVEHDGSRLLLDCGNGSLARLTEVAEVTELDGVLLSHLHPDHFADLYGLYFALRFSTPAGRVPLYAPAGTLEWITRILPPDHAGWFADQLPVTEVAAGQELAVGGLGVTLFPARHPVETVASRIAAGGRVIAYSGDSAPTPALDGCARDADLFVCDSTWLERDRPLPDGVHMTAAEAGAQAATAGAQRLLVTHVTPRNDPEDAAAEARTRYDGEVLVARDLDVHNLGAR